jgi:hypothetical protein
LPDDLTGVGVVKKKKARRRSKNIFLVCVAFSRGPHGRQARQVVRSSRHIGDRYFGSHLEMVQFPASPNFGWMQRGGS